MASGAIIYLHLFAEEMNKARRMAALQSRPMNHPGFVVAPISLKAGVIHYSRGWICRVADRFFGYGDPSNSPTDVCLGAAIEYLLPPLLENQPERGQCLTIVLEPPNLN